MALPSPQRAVASASALARAALRPERPDRLPRAALALAAWGPTMAGIVAAASARYPLAPAVIDDEGRMSYADLWAASDGVARGLRARGVGSQSTIGVLARNHRGFVVSIVAAAKVGADVVYLNTGFAKPQLADVVDHEEIDAVLHDDEFAGIVAGCGAAIALTGSELRALAVERSYVPLRPVRRTGRQVILTSGTTGRPKGAARSTTGGVDALTPLFETVPVRARSTVVIAAPLFHAWGLAHLGVGLGLSSTAVVQSRFDPEQTLASIAANRADGLVVVPVMLQRIMALDDAVLRRHDTSSLRYIASSGSAIGAPLVRAVLDRFGPILHNIYGSTEVSLATVAGPADLRAAPSTAGRPAPGSIVRILDDDGNEVPWGVVGRIFVGSASRFEGYTGGGGKEEIGGLLSSGDVGHFDEHGRLFVEGRDDDMIVSGGENVFPSEVEDLLAAHPAISEVAVVGIRDEEFGQRLHAVVVKRPRAKLTEKQVKDHVRAHLARYKVPRTVAFVDALPRTTTGKVLRRELVERSAVNPMQDKLDDLHKRREQAYHAGSSRAVERQHEKGKLLARERIEYLLDEGSFNELDLLARHRASGLEERPYTDGVITGWGTVEGRKVFVFSQDFTVFGGALGEVFAEKIHKMMDLALKVGAPVVGLNDGAGARIQEGVVSLASYGGIFYRNVLSSGVVPQISVVLGPCAGGAVYSPAMTDFIFMVRESSHMFITGPDVVKTVTGEDVTLEELGGAMSHASKSGVATFVSADEKSCLDDVRYLLSFLPQNNMEEAPQVETDDDPQRLCPELNELLPASPNLPYDMHAVVEAVLDDGEFMEYFPHWARSILCGFGRVDGRTVGIVGNQPMVLAGVLDIESSEKAARFVRTCDAFNIPLVTFVDVPGFLPGVDQEYGGIIRHGAKLLYAYCEATVPRIQVITRKAYGGAYVVMNSKSIGADLAFAWPSAELAVMGPQGAVEIVYRRELQQAADPAARRAELVAEYTERYANPYAAAERGYVDDVIDPAETRQKIVAGLAMLRSKREELPRRKHGNMPL